MTAEIPREETDAQLSSLRGGRSDANIQTGRQYDHGPVERSRIVPKPVPRAQVDDPREFQIQQLRRRFSPTEKVEDDGTTFTFRMVPSDPDFPFELVGLECVLRVPLTYSTGGKPSLHVTNKEMGRGYQINVEKGFDALVAKAPEATLLGLMNALDKQLEALLTEQKAETIKLLPNVGPKPPQQAAVVAPAASSQRTVPAVESKAAETFSAHQKEQAEARRETETRQLEARLGRLPLFSKSSDGIVYTVPIEPRKPGDLPVPLQFVRTVKLFVPLLYNLQPCRIELQGVSKDAASTTEKAFEQRAKAYPEVSLMGHINYLSQNMHVLATTPSTQADGKVSAVPSQAPSTVTHAAVENVPKPQPLDDRSHIQVIPRPPEWILDKNEDDESESDDYDSYDSSDESLDDAAGGATPQQADSSTSPEHGILLSFPFLELYGIELLELVSLCITIKCDRCKTTMDVNNLRNNINREAAGLRLESCKKCASAMSIGKYDPTGEEGVLGKDTNVLQATGGNSCMQTPCVRDTWISMGAASSIFCLGIAYTNTHQLQPIDFGAVTFSQLAPNVRRRILPLVLCLCEENRQWRIAGNVIGRCVCFARPVGLVAYGSFVTDSE